MASLKLGNEMTGPRDEVSQGIKQESEVWKQCCDVEGCIGNPRLDNPENEYSENPSPGILLFRRGVTMFEALHPEVGE